jgi:hypothetical protein
MNPFDFINSVSHNKKDLITDSENPEFAEKLYQPFLVNRGLSYFPDTIMFSNEMNQNPTIDNKLQYHFLLNSLRPAKRFAKWAKKVESDDFSAVQQYYQYSNQKTMEILSLLSSQQITLIKRRLEKGGS